MTPNYETNFFKLAENSWQVFATLRLSEWEGSSNGLTAVWKTQHKAFYHFLHIPDGFLWKAK